MNYRCPACGAQALGGVCLGPHDWLSQTNLRLFYDESGNRRTTLGRMSLARRARIGQHSIDQEDGRRVRYVKAPLPPCPKCGVQLSEDGEYQWCTSCGWDDGT